MQFYTLLNVTTSLHALLAEHAEHERDRDGLVQHVAEALAVLYEAIGPEPEWQVEAACRGQVATMFPERGQSTAPGKALCASCPVLEECRAWAAEGVEPFGIVAGLSARQRRPQRRPAAA